MKTFFSVFLLLLLFENLSSDEDSKYEINGEVVPEWVILPYEKNAIALVGTSDIGTNKEIKAILNALIIYSFDVERKVKEMFQKNKNSNAKQHIKDNIVNKEVTSQRYGNIKVSAMQKTFKTVDNVINYEMVAKIVFKDYEIRLSSTKSGENNSLNKWSIPKHFPYESFIKELKQNNMVITKKIETKDFYYVLLAVYSKVYR